MNDETFKPENKTISELFNIDKIYRIPNYQRQYNWDDEHLEALWDDLYESYENQTNRCYFLGSIVVVKSGDYLDLIDGQQRITTLMIMMDVLRKDFKDLNKETDAINYVDVSKIDSCILHNGRINRLQLQSDPNYDATFKNKIIKSSGYKDLSKPTKKQLKADQPEYKYYNTAYFFYNKFKSLSQEVLDDFVNYIFFKTNIISIVCNDESFAIKLFQVLNDRGLDLSNADLVKAEIFGKYDIEDEEQKKSFNTQWNSIVTIANNYEFTMDDFIVYYEYFKLKSNPKRQVIDEIKVVLKGKDPDDIISEMTDFSESVENVCKSTDSVIYSLRYIPWKSFVMTALASADYVKYPNIEGLHNIIRRFFYISLISGGTLNTIKHTSFKLIENIIEKKSLEEISSNLNDLIHSKKMIKKVYEALDSEVYDEKFLKALLLSLDYYVREDANKAFYPIDKNLHMEHILPRAYKKEKSWNYIKNHEEADAYLNTLGNMALLSYDKNEECENFGFDKKLRIYQGKNADGTNKSGITSFETTRVIIADAEERALKRMLSTGADKKEYIWDVKCIKDRKEYLLELIEDMLDISRDDIELNVITDTPNGLDKWKYNNQFYNNKEIILKTLTDFIESNNYTTLEEIPEELKLFKMHSHELIKSELTQEDIDNGYDYKNVKINGINLWLRNFVNTPDTMEYINLLKKYFSIDVSYIEGLSINNRFSITEDVINNAYNVAKSVYENVIAFDDAVYNLVNTGMNYLSAKIYINDFIYMMNGEKYKRALSALAADIYIDRIRNDYGKEFSSKAIKALELNIEYQNECGMKNEKLEEVLNNQKRKQK